MRGRHFGFLGTVCVVWITTRIGLLSVLPAATGASTGATPPKLAASQTAQTVAGNDVSANTAMVERCCAKRQMPIAQGRHSSAYPVHNLSLAAASPTRLPLSPSQTVASAPVAPLWPMPGQQPQHSRLNFYVYSFFRSDAQASGLVGGGQYGGSQSGFVATYALARFPGDNGNARLALLARGAIAHDRIAERELAAGLRWQPSSHMPLTLTAERRFRNARADAFAVYFAGGKSQVALPLKFRLDAYAQAGFVSGKDGGPFFDGITRAERKLTAIGKAPVTLGAGIWSGGQKGIFRVDAGPTIGSEIALGTAHVRINADWRFRIAGDASPASGPALTLSTSF